MKKAMSLLTATAMAATLLAGCGGGAASSSAAPAADSTSTEASSTAAEPAADAAAEEGKVLNIWCWNDEFQSRFNDYYPGVKEIAADKSTTTLDNGVTVKWTINPNDNNNYQNKLDEALLKQDSAAADDKIDIFLIEADYALKYVDSEYTLDVKKDVGLTDDDQLVDVGGGGAGKPVLPGLDGLHEALVASQITDLYPVPHQRTDALPAEFSSGPALQQPLRCADVVEAAEGLFNAAPAQKLTT